MLAAIYDRPDNIPYVSRRGGYLYNLWKDADHPARPVAAHHARGVSQSRSVLGDRCWTSTSSPQAKARTGCSAASATRPGSSRAILSLSRGGSDAVTLREFDVDTKSFVADGFTLPEAKGGVDWLDADTLLLSSAYGEGMATTSGYARTVRLWRRGQAARSGASDLRDHGRPYGGSMAASTIPGRSRASGSSTRSTSSTTASGCATQPAPRRSSICRPASGCRRMATGSR